MTRICGIMSVEPSGQDESFLTVKEEGIIGAGVLDQPFHASLDVLLSGQIAWVLSIIS